jgi:periplasmic protein TonB
MRKVYQPEKRTLPIAMAVLMGVGVTGVLFGILPFTHIIATPSRTLELRKAAVADLPPPPQEETPPPQEEEKNVEDVKPQLADAPPQQNLNLSVDLELAVGTGGALAMGNLASALNQESGGQELNAFSVADLDKPPVLMASVSPEYPATLRKAKVEGSVVIVFLLDESGRVEEAKVESASRPEFETPALNAVKKWKFKPGEREGAAVKTHMRLPIRFKIQNS